MPRKTKRQKILARIHRNHFVNSQNTQPQITVSLPQVDKLSVNTDIVTKPQISHPASEYAYVKRDLIKITIFTFLAVIFQGVLYFVLHRG
ncbi:hypothetical protein MUP32_03150 [Candidatus Microgenomates bacterium]|nr:hypothetical protein [Candidatus Microgenomates bacterium]